MAARPERAGGGARRDRPARRARARDGRRRQLPREPVQPRRAGRAAAGLVVQAVRARDRARPGHLPDDDLRVSSPVHDLARRPATGTSHNYEGSNLGPIDLDDGDDVLRQHRLRAADASSSGRRRSSRTARELGITSPLQGLLLDRRSAARRSTRSRWRARTRRSRTAASASTARLIGNQPRAVLVDRQRAGRTSPIAASRRSATNERGASSTALLQSVVDERARASARSSPDGRPVAGKTGTTENYGDAWFVGYTPQLVGRRLGRLPEQARADADRVPRRRRSPAARSRR